ncbi:MAG: hypothetical protein KIT36_03770 [Alphaproteobacteria bacterium]|nr:hypothetical protein [Alphaproteobacteria bacterium]
MTLPTLDFAPPAASLPGWSGTSGSTRDHRTWAVPPRACRLGRLSDAPLRQSPAMTIAGAGIGSSRRADIHR